MKIIGSIVIILSLSLIGRLSSNKLSKHVNYLNLMIEVLEFIKSDMSYNKSAILEITKKLSKDIYLDKLGLFDRLYKKLIKGKSMINAWKEALKDNDIKFILNKSELAEIERIGYWLGNSDVEGQISNINLTLDFLKKNLIKAQEDKEKYYKIYNNLGVLSGIAVVILIW